MDAMQDSTRVPTNGWPLSRPATPATNRSDIPLTMATRLVNAWGPNRGHIVHDNIGEQNSTECANKAQNDTSIADIIPTPCVCSEHYSNSCCNGTVAGRITRITTDFSRPIRAIRAIRG